MDAFKPRQQALEKKDRWAALAEEAREEKKMGKLKILNVLLYFLGLWIFKKALFELLNYSFNSLRFYRDFSIPIKINFYKYPIIFLCEQVNIQF